MSVVDEIKSRLDIVQYILQSVPLKRAGRTYKACCPFHNERTPSFVVDPNRQTWRCYGACATGGDVFNFAMRQHGWTFAEALQELGKLVGVEVKPRSPEQTARDEASERLRGLVKAAAQHFHERLLDASDPEAVQTLAYARAKRGLTDATIAQFMIGYAPQGWRTTLDQFTALGYSEDDLIEAGLAVRSDSGRVYDRFRHRLMIPIRDERGRPIGFGARALAAEDNPKYLNSPQTPLFDKSHVLFALDLAGPTIRDQGTVVIVEGYLDAIQAHQAGYTNVVAQMGTALTESQLKLIAPRWAHKIVLALDSDAAGQNATRRSLEVAREALQADYGGRLSVDIRILTVPGAKDPDDFIREHSAAWAELVAEAQPVADYVIAIETEALPPKASLHEREAIARRVLPLLLASESDLYRKDNLQKLALKLHIAERDLLAWAQEQQAIRALKSSPMPEPPPAADGDIAPLESTQTATPTRAQPSTDNALERDFLRLLFQQPDLIYHVNRKFRELAAGDARLLAGALNDLCLDDFNHADYRLMASLLGEAIEQDSEDTLMFVRARLHGDLLQAFEDILAGDLVLLRPLLRHGLSADLETVVLAAQRSYGAPDFPAEIVEKALRLRKQRLLRERQEILFLQMEAQEHSDESTPSHDLHILLNELRLAQQRIELSLKQPQRTMNA